MSRAKPTYLEHLGLAFECPTCRSMAGSWCTTGTSAPKSQLHGPRYQLAIGSTKEKA